MTICALDVHIPAMLIFLLMAIAAIDFFQSLTCKMFIPGYCLMAVSAADLYGVYGGFINVCVDLKLAFRTS